jgi:hypothetical protein
MSIRSLLVLAPAVFAALSSSAARGAPAGENPVETLRLRQEIAGLEVSPFSVGTGTSSLGIGATLRLGRHRWTGVYWTPVQAGFFAGGRGWKETILLKIQTELGWVHRYQIGTIEAGLGAGLGALGMQTAPTGCDGACGVGGEGVLFSPVARFLFRDRATHTVGAFIRAEIPAGRTQGESVTQLRGFGMTVLVGLDLAGGWG